MDATQSLPHKFMVNYAVEPERKASPNRLIIIVITFVCSLFLSILTLLILENFKAIKSINSVPRRDS